MRKSQDCWPADGPQDGDVASYAGLFGRLAWHCAGTLRIVDDESFGGCEGGGIRFWPEREWRDNGNLDQARAILAQGKDMPEYRKLSWGDLITFAGTVGIKASGGPANKFCFGRVDASDGSTSVELGVEGIEDCAEGQACKTHALCEESFHWDEQDTTDDARCKLEQSDGRLQASHSVGLIYVFPHGPQLKSDQPDYDGSLKHQRSPRLSAEEVRDTFNKRMGWTDQETVALVGGGHTLGRAHGACAQLHGAGSCKGKYTTTAGYEGVWTRTPSQWNYDFFGGLFESECKLPRYNIAGIWVAFFLRCQRYRCRQGCRPRAPRATTSGRPPTAPASTRTPSGSRPTSRSSRTRSTRPGLRSTTTTTRSSTKTLPTPGATHPALSGCAFALVCLCNSSPHFPSRP